jgi:predicted cupin superfamily sugar epimerase
MNRTAASHYIENLNMQAHPEGGYYASVFRHAIFISEEAHPAIPEGGRSLSSTIYYLLHSGEVSRFHRLGSDEMWFFHDGCPMVIHTFRNGVYAKQLLGLDIANGQMPQQLIEAGTIFGAEPMHAGSFSLVSCMVSPGFDFQDFHLCSLGELMSEAPSFKSLFIAMQSS